MEAEGAPHTYQCANDHTWHAYVQSGAICPTCGLQGTRLT